MTVNPFTSLRKISTGAAIFAALALLFALLAVMEGLGRRMIQALQQEMKLLIAFVTGIILGLFIRALLKSFLGVIVAGVAVVAGIATGKTEMSLLGLIPVLLAARRGG